MNKIFTSKLLSLLPTGNARGGFSPRFATLLGAAIGFAFTLPFFSFNPDPPPPEPEIAQVSQEAEPPTAPILPAANPAPVETPRDVVPPETPRDVVPQSTPPAQDGHVGSEDLEEDAFSPDGGGEGSVAPPQVHPRLRVMLPPLEREEVRNLRRLAIRMERKGDLIGGEAQYRKILAVMEPALGPEHPELVKPLNELGRNLMRQNRLPQAEEVLNRARGVVTISLGAEDAMMANVLLALGQLKEKQGDKVAALALFRESLTNREKNYGPTHHFVVGPLFALGNLLTGMDKLDEARTLIERGLALTGKYSGPGSRFHILSHLHRARLQKAAKEYDSAEKTLIMMRDFFDKRPMAERKRILPPILKMLVEVLEAQGKKDQALGVQQKIFELQGTGRQTQTL